MAELPCNLSSVQLYNSDTTSAWRSSPAYAMCRRFLHAVSFSFVLFFAAVDGLDALRKELASSKVAATRDDKLAAALAELQTEEKDALRWYKEARDKGTEGQGWYG